MNIELKPCPFCGAAPATNCFGSEGVFPEMACVICINEECASRPEVWGETEEAAAEAWNTRAERTCRIVKTWSDSDFVDGWRYRCSECMAFILVNERDPETGDVISAANYCPNCGAKVVE